MFVVLQNFSNIMYSISANANISDPFVFNKTLFLYIPFSRQLYSFSGGMSHASFPPPLPVNAPRWYCIYRRKCLCIFMQCRSRGIAFIVVGRGIFSSSKHYDYRILNKIEMREGRLVGTSILPQFYDHL